MREKVQHCRLPIFKNQFIHKFSAGGGVAEDRGGVIKQFLTTPPRLRELTPLTQKIT